MEQNGQPQGVTQSEGKSGFVKLLPVTSTFMCVYASCGRHKKYMLLCGSQSKQFQNPWLRRHTLRNAAQGY